MRQVEHGRDPPPRQLETRRADRERHGRRHRERGGAANGRQRRCRDVGRIDPHRQHDRMPLERAQGADEQRPGRGPVEHPSRLSGSDAELEPVADEPRVAMRGVDRLCHEPELVGDRRRRGAGSGRGLGREEAQLEPPEASDEAEAVSTARRLVDRLRPVDPDAELGGRHGEAVGARGEVHGHPRDLLPLPFERRTRLGAAYPADVDAVHARARRQLVRRARVEQAEAQRRENGEQAQPRHTDAEPLARCGPAARANCRGGCGHGRRILAVMGREPTVPFPWPIPPFRVQSRSVGAPPGRRSRPPAATRAPQQLITSKNEKLDAA